MPPMIGVLGSYLHTTEGANVTFQCRDGYVPSAIMTSTCTSNASWTPAPQEHNCTLVIGERITQPSFFSVVNKMTMPCIYIYIAIVNVSPLQSVPRPAFDCPGEVISYNCSILSNSENVHLIWQVTVPGQMPVNITYNRSSTSDINKTDMLNTYISSSLNRYVSNEYIESTLELIVQVDVSLNGTNVECILEGLANDSIELLLNTSGMLHAVRMYIENDNDIIIHSAPHTH